MPERAPPTGLLDVVKAAFWPGIAILAFVCFGSPLVAVLNAVPSIISSVDSVDISGVKFHVARGTVLPQPAAAVTTALRLMNKSDIDLILSVAPDTQYCDSQGVAVYNRLDTLRKLGLAEHITQSSSLTCPAFTRLDDAGKQVRDYLIAVITSQIDKK